MPLTISITYNYFVWPSHYIKVLFVFVNQLFLSVSIFTLTLCICCRVSLPYVLLGVAVMGTSSAITVEAKLGIKLIWNLDDSLDVCSPPCQMYTRLSCLWSGPGVWNTLSASLKQLRLFLKTCCVHVHNVQQTHA